MKPSRRALLLWSIASLAVGRPDAQALQFNLTPTFDISSGNGALAYHGFQLAAERWSRLLGDPITVNLQIGFQALGAGVLGQTDASDGFSPYSAVKGAMIADATSADDALAVAHLPAGSPGSFNVFINRTADHPDGSGSATPYLDTAGANNLSIYRTTANAKALGLLDPQAAASDGSVTFSSQFSFDFDPSDGIAAGKFDFVGIALHEIGHALGFVSGVEVLDYNSPFNGTYYAADEFTFVTPLDLFRRSSRDWTVVDFTADTRAKFITIDNGLTTLGSLSTGALHGDGRQASHWKDNLGLGIMDPTFAPGELGVIRAADLRAFDIMGYSVIPEPATALFGLALLGACGFSRRRRG